VLQYFRKLLFPLSILYYFIVQIRNFLYVKGIKKSYEAGIPVISIGNLSTGGTGKTPMACYTIGYLLTQGLKVGYLSRGYGRETKGYRKVMQSADSARMYGDESVLIASRFPDIAVSVSEDRILGAKKMQREDHIEVLVLDDAFQHRRIQRDLDIVMIDATRMPDRDLPLPAGNLRETKGALKRADLVVVNKIQVEDNRDQYEKRLNHHTIAFSKSAFTGVIFFRPELMDVLPIDELLKRPVLVFSGLGNNEQFFRQLELLGVEILRRYSYPDHYSYTPEDLKTITLEYRRQVPERPDLMILTTEKDYCRLNSVNLPATLALYPCAFIRMELQWIEGEYLVQQSILKALHNDRKRAIQ
jgi:tetraacyldisaccharide 4'-kinase